MTGWGEVWWPQHHLAEGFVVQGAQLLVESQILVVV